MPVSGFYMLNYLVKYFDDLGINKIIGLDNFFQNQIGLMIYLKTIRKLELYQFNIAKDEIKNIKNAEKVNFVIHMASIVPQFFENIHFYLGCQYLGLRQLLDFYKERKDFRSFLFFSSSEIIDPDQKIYHR